MAHPLVKATVIPAQVESPMAAGLMDSGVLQNDGRWFYRFKVPLINSHFVIPADAGIQENQAHGFRPA
ncbi:MAG: hypothetical protein KDI35_06685, partial [Gammaproteobacteria bacterium]|nr:hypothetical protein [Gammaproteobacteria bacterium]